jgi:hypothetical protein
LHITSASDIAPVSGSAGQRVGTSLAEGMAENLVNRRMNNSQHMRWSRDGALHLLQIRAAILNDNFKGRRARSLNPQL